jgi:Fatty acid hydroxylase superfamily
MPSETEVRAETRAQGLRTKRNNLLAALLSGVFLVWISVRFFPHSIPGIALGFVGGLLYANAFEYCLHRFILHAGRGFLFKQHMLHHSTWSAPEAARYVNFSRNPLGVVAVFAVNAVPFLLFQWIFRTSWTAGVFASFTVYYVAFEEIHWRSHMGGWLPQWLRFAARHHLLHHAHETGEYNVFLPIFDRIVEGLHTQASVSTRTLQR